ncbi:hypothetical protein LMG1866_02781 [Achromobacter ruhlandii]|nr:hypothetical protein LMG1866_02781 [Achromobacter ruhlandii]
MHNSGPTEQTEFGDFLQQLVDRDHLEGAALGITKLVIDKGESFLTDKQRYVFQKEVLDVFVKESCVRGCSIPWSEMYEAYDNGGLCSYCAHMNGRMESE